MTSLEQRLADHLAHDAKRAVPEHRFDEVITGLVDSGRRHRRSRVAMYAACVVLVIGAAALAVQRVGVVDEPAPASAPATRELSSVEEFGPSDWVVATVLPEGLSWAFALEPSEVFGTISRSAQYEGVSEEAGGPALAVTLTDQPGLAGARSAEVAGVSWRVDDTDVPSFWGAEAEVGGRYVQVQASGPFDPAVLAGLEVVDRSELPTAPLGDRSRAVRVATASTGQTAYYEVQQSGDRYCFWTSNESGWGGGCGAVIDPDSMVTIDGGNRDMADGAMSSTVAIAGSASTEVHRVEVEFVDGTLAEALPTDLSGQFDRTFWIVATAIEHPTATSRDQPAGVGNVREVRAYAHTGELLDAVHPGDPGSGSFGNF